MLIWALFLHMLGNITQYLLSDKEEVLHNVFFICFFYYAVFRTMICQHLLLWFISLFSFTWRWMVVLICLLSSAISPKHTYCSYCHANRHYIYIKCIMMINKVKEPRIICYTVCSLPGLVLMLIVCLSTSAGSALGRWHFWAIPAEEHQGKRVNGSNGADLSLVLPQNGNLLSSGGNYW